MIFLRFFLCKETEMGKTILNETKAGRREKKLDFPRLYRETMEVLLVRKGILLLVVCNVLYNVYLPLGSFSSLFFVPYMKEVFGIDKAWISILGSVFSASTLFVFILVNPVLSRCNRVRVMLAGLGIQAVSLGVLVFAPLGRISTAIAYVVLFAIGSSVFKPFMDSILADYTEGSRRAGIYALMNVVLSVTTALIGFLSGYLYAYRPEALFIISIFLVVLCIFLLGLFRGGHFPPHAGNAVEPG